MLQANWEELFIGPIGSFICGVLQLKDISRLYSCSRAMRSSYNLIHAIQTRKTYYDEEYTEKYQCRVIKIDKEPVIFSLKLSENITELEYSTTGDEMLCLYALLQHTKSLRKLTLYWLSDATCSLDLNCLAESNLKSIWLHNIGKVTDLHFLPKRLEELRLDCSEINMLSKVDFSNLKKLRISCSELAGDLTFFYNLPKLESLYFKFGVNLDIEQIFLVSKHLREAYFSNFGSESINFSLAKNLIKLSLSIDSVDVPRMTITTLPPRLEVLESRGLFLIISEGLAECPNLKEIDVSPIRNYNTLLSRCPNLEKLTCTYEHIELIGCPNVTEVVFVYDLPDSLSFLCNFPKLKTVTCVDCLPNPEDVEYWISRVTLVFKEE